VDRWWSEQKFWCQKEKGAAINDIHSHSMTINGNEVSNDKLYERIKVCINAETR